MSNVSSPAVGAKIMSLRESKNMTREEVSERSGLSLEQIRSIEEDQHLPSLGPLIKVARALGVRLGTFLDDSEELGPVVCRAQSSEGSISFSNGSDDARKHMEYHSLAGQKAGRHMEPFIIDINPNGDTNYQLSAHEGEEFIYVMGQHLLRLHRQAPPTRSRRQAGKDSCRGIYTILSTHPQPTPYPILRQAKRLRRLPEQGSPTRSLSPREGRSTYC